MVIKGKFTDILAGRVYPAEVRIEDKKILSVRELDSDQIVPERYICPGFIDAHVHIESSMLVPSEFARLAVVHGTVATISDPHEIGNVLGMKGIVYMIENSQKVPFHIYFAVPSCVPATNFETAAAKITAEDIRTLFVEYNLKYLSEMMN